MYLRTIQRRNKDGSVVRYVQLAHNVWDPERGYAVAKVVHSFGRADRRASLHLWGWHFTSPFMTAPTGGAAFLTSAGVA